MIISTNFIKHGYTAIPPNLMKCSPSINIQTKHITNGQDFGFLGQILYYELIKQYSEPQGNACTIRTSKVFNSFSADPRYLNNPPYFYFYISAVGSCVTLPFFSYTRTTSSVTVTNGLIFCALWSMPHFKYKLALLQAPVQC